MLNNTIRDIVRNIMKKELIINKAKQLYSKPQARSLLLNVLALVVVLLIGAPHYEYDMDVMMQAQLFNISGVPYRHGDLRLRDDRGLRLYGRHDHGREPAVEPGIHRHARL